MRTNRNAFLFVKQALGYLGYYFYEIVVPQAKDKIFKLLLAIVEEQIIENSWLVEIGF